MAEIKPISPTALLALKAHRQQLSGQQYRTLRGLVLAGDDEGALKGLRKILRRKRQGVSSDCR